MATGRKSGGGSRKGIPNKVNKVLRDMIIGALDDCGGQRYLAEQARANPRAFLSLIGRVLPMQVSGERGGPALGIIVVPAKNLADR